MLHHGAGRVCKRAGTSLLIWLVTALVSSVVWFARPVPAAASDAGRLVSLINSARAGAGLRPVLVNAKLSSIAQAHAQRMASGGRIFHNSSFASEAAPWEAWGENVGSGADVNSIHRAFMSSASHKRTMLTPGFNLVGVGIAMVSGKIMVVEDFIKRSGVATARGASVTRDRSTMTEPPAEVPGPEATEPMACHWNGELEPASPTEAIEAS